MMAALCVVLMMLGGILEIGAYAAPMFAGLCTIPVGQQFGKKPQLLLWVAASLLCFLLVPNVEENLIFAGFFGWYPILHPELQKLPKVPRMLAKLAVFNVVMIAIEALVILVLVPESLGAGYMLLLLVLANLTFLIYDNLIPRMEEVFRRIGKGKA